MPARRCYRVANYPRPGPMPSRCRLSDLTRQWRRLQQYSTQIERERERERGIRWGSASESSRCVHSPKDARALLEFASAPRELEESPAGLKLITRRHRRTVSSASRACRQIKGRAGAKPSPKGNPRGSVIRSIDVTALSNSCRSCCTRARHFLRAVANLRKAHPPCVGSFWRIAQGSREGHASRIDQASRECARCVYGSTEILGPHLSILSSRDRSAAQC